MHRRNPSTFVICITLCALATTQGNGLEDERETQQRLDDIRAAIDELDQEVTTARGENRVLEAQLRQTELEIGRIAQQVSAIAGSVLEKNARLAVLRHEREKLAAQHSESQAKLAADIRGLYAIVRQDPLKMLLNQHDASRLARTLRYANYLHQAHAKRLESLRRTGQQLQDSANEIERESANLQALQGVLRDTQGQLERQRAARAVVLAAVAARVSDGDKRLADLRANERQLNTVLARIRRELADIPATLDGRQPFATLKNRLPWPTEGAIVRAFGTPRGSGTLKWQGVVIGNEVGRHVRAVSPGRVAFADWLRGFGLMVIIDHGSGYMSLYGHNQSLRKTTGDWVETGDVIASVGNSGGNQQPGLYFEIRRRGVPLDPVLWCRGTMPPNQGARL